MEHAIYVQVDLQIVRTVQRINVLIAILDL